MSRPKPTARVDDRLGVGLALLLVGVEQGVVGPTVEHGGQLPGEVGGVPHPGAHPLAEEGRRLVGGVAGQEHPPVPPRRGHQPVEGVDRRPLDGGQAGSIHDDIRPAITSSRRTSSSDSPGSSMNSNRKRGAGMGTRVWGRAGSQTWRHRVGRPGTSPATSRSTTSHDSSKPVSRSDVPTADRVAERAPSQPDDVAGPQLRAVVQADVDPVVVLVAGTPPRHPEADVHTGVRHRPAQDRLERRLVEEDRRRPAGGRQRRAPWPTAASAGRPSGRRCRR